MTVNGDTTVEPDETFLVNLTNPAGATIADGQGVATITNDDVVPSTDPQPVVWTALVGVSANGNSLTKTSASGVNSGAVSIQQIPSGDGYVEVDRLRDQHLPDVRLLERKHRRLLPGHRLRPGPRARHDLRLREGREQGLLRPVCHGRPASRRRRGRGSPVLAQRDSSSTPPPRRRPTRCSSTPGSTTSARPSTTPSSRRALRRPRLPLLRRLPLRLPRRLPRRLLAYADALTHTLTYTFAYSPRLRPRRRPRHHRRRRAVASPWCGPRSSA